METKEKLLWNVGELKQTDASLWECTEASVEEDGIHYYVFNYVKANGKIGRSTWTMVGHRYNFKHIYSR
jgi:hypothetical protein